MSTALQAQRREADRALAVSAFRIQGLNWVLDDELLSELLDRPDWHIRRAPELIA
jgi:hypothetical protein